jgi:hypothetical protein
LKGSSLVSYGHSEATSFEDNGAIAPEFKIENRATQVESGSIFDN